MNYEVVERVLRAAIQEAGFDFSAQPVERGERIRFSIWLRDETTRTLGERPLYVPDPLPRLKDLESEQQVKDCAARGLRAARRAEQAG
jgi:hypothetical protein